MIVVVGSRVECTVTVNLVTVTLRNPECTVTLSPTGGQSKTY